MKRQIKTVEANKTLKKIEEEHIEKTNPTITQRSLKHLIRFMVYPIELNIGNENWIVISCVSTRSDNQLEPNGVVSCLRSPRANTMLEIASVQECT